MNSGDCEPSHACGPPGRGLSAAWAEPAVEPRRRPGPPRGRAARGRRRRRRAPGGSRLASGRTARRRPPGRPGPRLPRSTFDELATSHCLAFSCASRQDLGVPLGLHHRVVGLAHLERDSVEGVVSQGFELLDLRLGLLDLAGADAEVEVVLEADDGPDRGVVQGIDDVRVLEPVAVGRVGQVAQEPDEEERVALLPLDLDQPPARLDALAELGELRPARERVSRRTGPPPGWARCPPAASRPSGRRRTPVGWPVHVPRAWVGQVDGLVGQVDEPLELAALGAEPVEVDVGRVSALDEPLGAARWPGRPGRGRRGGTRGSSWRSRRPSTPA